MGKTRGREGNPILSELKPYKKYLVAGPFFKLLEAVLELMIPTLMVYVIDKGVANLDSGYVVRMGLVMLGIAIVGFGSALVCQYSASITSQGFGTRLRNKLFTHILALSENDADKFGTSTLVNRLTNDINVLQQSVAMLIRLVIRAPFICAGSLVMAMILDLPLSLVIICLLPLLIFTVWLIMKLTVPRYKAQQKQLDKLASVTGENLSGVRVIRAFSKVEAERKRYSEVNDEAAAKAVSAVNITSLLGPATSLIMNVAVIAVLWFGHLRIESADMTSGEIIAFVNYISYMVAALLVTANLVILFTKAWACYGRVMEVFGVGASEQHRASGNGDNPLERGQADGDSIKESDELDGESVGDVLVEFKDVSLRYSDDENIPKTLSNISFTLRRGQTLGIVGVTGSGKTSLVSLIPRIYDATEGSVIVNGRDVRDWNTKELRRYTAVAEQRAVLFTGTIADNIRQGKPDASDEDIVAAAQIAQADSFIRQKDGGYDAVVERGGVNYSGGQKQRISIARAVVGKPRVLIIDDSLSALDNATSAEVRKKLASSGIESFIIVSQRPAMLREADNIIVLDDGACVGMGKHDALIEECDIYAQLCSLSDAGSEAEEL